jgi:hypothetical protein
MLCQKLNLAKNNVKSRKSQRFRIKVAKID